jgi:hypothetical protein
VVLHSGIILVSAKNALGTGSLVVNIPAGADGGIIAEQAPVLANSLVFENGKLLTEGSLTFGGAVTLAAGVELDGELVFTGPIALTGGTVTLGGQQTFRGAIGLFGPTSLLLSAGANVIVGGGVTGGQSIVVSGASATSNGVLTLASSLKTTLSTTTLRADPGSIVKLVKGFPGKITDIINAGGIVLDRRS